MIRVLTRKLTDPTVAVAPIIIALLTAVTLGWTSPRDSRWDYVREAVLADARGASAIYQTTSAGNCEQAGAGAASQVTGQQVKPTSSCTQADSQRNPSPPCGFCTNSGNLYVVKYLKDVYPPSGYADVTVNCGLVQMGSCGWLVTNGVGGPVCANPKNVYNQGGTKPVSCTAGDTIVSQTEQP